MSIPHLQSGESCLSAASFNGHLEVVRYLCELAAGGEELLMMTNNVSGDAVCLQQMDVRRTSL